MGIRYQKRVNFGDGFGLNLSKSGVSSSYRTKYGSVGAKGFSIRTGIPGLTFRSGFGKSKKGEGAIITLMIFLLIGAVIIVAIIAYNIVMFIKWSVEETYKLIVRVWLNYKIKREIEFNTEYNKNKIIDYSEIGLQDDCHKIIASDDILIENYSENKKLEQ